MQSAGATPEQRWKRMKLMLLAVGVALVTLADPGRAANLVSPETASLGATGVLVAAGIVTAVIERRKPLA